MPITLAVLFACTLQARADADMETVPAADGNTDVLVNLAEGLAAGSTVSSSLRYRPGR